MGRRLLEMVGGNDGWKRWLETRRTLIIAYEFSKYFMILLPIALGLPHEWYIEETAAEINLMIAQRLL